jgi:hypothetical protein
MRKRDNWLFAFAAIGAAAAFIEILKYFGITPQITATAEPSVPVVPSYAGLIWAGLLFAFSLALSGYGLYRVNRRPRAPQGTGILITRAVFRCDQEKTYNNVTKDVQTLVDGKRLTVHAHQGGGFGDPCEKHKPFPPGHRKSLEIDYVLSGTKTVPYDKTATLLAEQWNYDAPSKVPDGRLSPILVNDGLGHTSEEVWLGRSFGNRAATLYFCGIRNAQTDVERIARNVIVQLHFKHQEDEFKTERACWMVMNGELVLGYRKDVDLRPGEMQKVLLAARCKTPTGFAPYAVELQGGDLTQWKFLKFGRWNITGKASLDNGSPMDLNVTFTIDPSGNLVDLRSLALSISA